MIIDIQEVYYINSFSEIEYLKRVYGFAWMLLPIFTLILVLFDLFNQIYIFLNTSMMGDLSNAKINYKNHIYCGQLLHLQTKLI